MSGFDDVFDDDAAYVMYWLHIIFSTKDQMPYLMEDYIREGVYDKLADTCTEQGGSCAIAAGGDDHVHVLMESVPGSTTAELVKTLKRASRNWMRERGGFFADFEWQQGCLCMTVNDDEVPRIKEELSRQEQYHKEVPYKTEFVELLIASGIEPSDDIWI